MRAKTPWTIALFGCLGCAATAQPTNPGIALPVSLGEGSLQPGKSVVAPTPEQADQPARLSRASTARDQRVRYGSLPDPKPLSTERQWRYTVQLIDGLPQVRQAEPLQFERPVVTARRTGRYALELWIGRELIDRVRFNFPLGSDAPPSGEHPSFREPVSLSQGASSVQRILVPASDRATRALLVDRATGETWELPWPPDRPAARSVHKPVPSVSGHPSPAASQAAEDVGESPVPPSSESEAQDGAPSEPRLAN